MRKMRIIIAASVCFLFVSVIATASGYRTGFNDYQIEAVENVNLGKDIDKVWNLSYNGSDKPVTVVKRNTSDGVAYVVNNPFFEVCYTNSAKGFGVKTVKRAWSSVPREICSVVLNADEMKKQGIITPNRVDDEQALGLIANYLPELLNENYTHLLN
jgi:predicted metal-dependent enzyme (double-stranded beta helix superfamily)